MPNMYARGILWGKMVLELGDSCTARNERNGLFADIQFKTKVPSHLTLLPSVFSLLIVKLGVFFRRV